MAKSGIEHVDVGDELTKAEWESEQSHALVHGNAFPAGPVERQLFYRDDLNTLYIYNGTAWISSDVTSHAALTTGVHGLGALHVAGFHSAGQAVSKAIWLDVGVQKLANIAIVANIGWTDIDVTGDTSANAKLALLEIILVYAVTSGVAADNFLKLRKNGTVPIYWPAVQIRNTQPQWTQAWATAIVGLDAGQVFEYAVDCGAGATLEAHIQLLGYIE